MKKYIDVLKKTNLFNNISSNDIKKVTECLKMRISTYKKGEYIYHSGDIISCVGVVAFGTIIIQKNDYWGNRSIVNRILEYEIFGESYAMQENKPLLNDVISENNSVILFFETKNLLSTCKNVCDYHKQIIENLLKSISLKNLSLTQKIDCMSKRSTKEKLISYLSSQSKIANSSSFDIPFNRQQLADYLSIDRSAMSKELCKMRDMGMLEFNKNHFKLLN